MILTTLVLIAIMFILQSFLGYWQVKNFNKHYAEMRSNGKVVIGRSKGIIRTGVVLLISIDNRANIVEARKMQGVTVFARFKKVKNIENQHLLRTDDEVVNKMDRFTRKAFEDSRHVYRVVQAGGDLEKPKSPLEKLFGLFIKKGEVKRS